MRLQPLAAFAACLLLFAVQAFAQDTDYADYIQGLDAGAVNWQTGYVTAKGVGVPSPNAVSLAQAQSLAVRAATVEARRNLLAVIRSVQVTADATVQDAMNGNDGVLERVRGILQNSQILDTAQMSDGSVEVVVGMSLRGGLSNALFSPDMPFMFSRPGMTGNTASQPSVSNTNVQPVSAPQVTPAPSSEAGEKAKLSAVEELAAMLIAPGNRTAGQQAGGADGRTAVNEGTGGHDIAVPVVASPVTPVVPQPVVPGVQSPIAADMNSSVPRMAAVAQAGPFTGVLIDARGLDARPALIPVVQDEPGSDVYGSRLANRETAVQNGIAGYARTAEGASVLGRVGANPAVIRPVGVRGKARTNLVVSEADAVLLRRLASEAVLGDCRVVIVLD
ncbi:LPP20 family lipoprotein [Desulfovibrio psychrotolerans]|uniref:Lipoprotein n=1 Tax=Desulfovibrio psychrotolerans TaxID=415242 RepID=A0A7J0BV23_9BACT|nr:LPP20 family lipoprotein [Desulfovibrio psychrotolerans]GFM37508.1 hypothetical protein DSM19430T_21920 [Desulfovibrio psychrotolerans]